MARMSTRTVTAAAGLTLLGLGVMQGTALASDRTGFAEPFAGNPRYERYAPTLATTAAQVNQPIGRARADRIARAIGLNPALVFSPATYAKFISGKGKGGDPAAAKLVDASVRILTNTTGRPLYSDVNGVRTPTVLASYGLIVNTDGLLESPANSTAPTRKVNAVLEPGGYMGKWARRNKAYRSIAALYASAYTSEAVYSNNAQQSSGAAQLVPNTQPTGGVTVGMSMAPALWVVNFALIYTLNPAKAALMPAHWTPMPAEVAAAIAASPTGQVQYSDFASVLPPSR